MANVEERESLDGLAARASLGDLAAFDELLSQTSAYLRFLIKQAVPCWDWYAQEDLAQDLIVRLMELFKRSPERLPTSHWGAWLTVVVRRQVVDRVRRQHRRPGEFFLESDMAEALNAQASTPSARLRREEEFVGLAKAVAGLTPELRKVAELRLIEKLSVHETAKRLNKSQECIHMATKRAVHQLNQLLGPSRSGV